MDGSQSSRYVTTILDNALSDLSIKDFSQMDNGTAGRICTQFNVPVYVGVGQWYLPPIGELGYMIARYKRISFALGQIKANNRTAAALLDDNLPYWSSTLGDSGSEAWCINVSTGFVARTSLDNENYVRAFARF